MLLTAQLRRERERQKPQLSKRLSASVFSLCKNQQSTIASIMHGRGHTKFATSAKKLLELSTPSYVRVAPRWRRRSTCLLTFSSTKKPQCIKTIVVGIGKGRLPSKLLAYQSVAQYHVFLVMLFQHTPCSLGTMYSADTRLEFVADSVN